MYLLIRIYNVGGKIEYAGKSLLLKTFNKYLEKTFKRLLYFCFQ